MRKIPGRLHTSKVVGQRRPSYGNLLLRQGIDSEFPVPYVHKVGSVGRRPVGDGAFTASPASMAESLGFPKKRMPIRPARTTRGALPTRGLEPAIATEILCIDPEVWETEDLTDNIGPVYSYVLSDDGKFVRVSFRPWSTRNRDVRDLPKEACAICENKADFIAWAGAITGDQQTQPDYGPK